MKNRAGLNQKQEIFSRLVAKGWSEADAYLEAFQPKREMEDQEVRAKAAAVLGRKKVKIRIQALQDQAAIAAVVSIEGLTKKVLEICEAACFAGNYGPSVSAVKLAAQLNGLLVDKREVKDVTAITETNLLKGRERLVQMGRGGLQLIDQAVNDDCDDDCDDDYEV